MYRETQAGISSQLGELSGITGLSSPRRLEIAPYAVMKNVTVAEGGGFGRGDHRHLRQPEQRRVDRGPPPLECRGWRTRLPAPVSGQTVPDPGPARGKPCQRHRRGDGPDPAERGAHVSAARRRPGLRPHPHLAHRGLRAADLRQGERQPAPVRNQLSAHLTGLRDQRPRLPQIAPTSRTSRPGPSSISTSRPPSTGACSGT